MIAFGDVDVFAFEVDAQTQKAGIVAEDVLELAFGGIGRSQGLSFAWKLAMCCVPLLVQSVDSVNEWTDSSHARFGNERTSKPTTPPTIAILAQGA